MQQINLFLPEFVPTPQRFNLRALMQWLIALLVLLMLIGLFLAQQLRTARHDTEQAREKQNAVITAISQTHGDQEAQTQMAAKRAELEAQLARRQALLTDLQQREQRQTVGFAPLLQTLATHHDKRLWLTHIEVEQGQIALAGETLSAAAVPTWLGQLQTLAPIQGQRFGGLSLSRIEDKPGVLAFRVHPDAGATASSKTTSNPGNTTTNATAASGGSHATTP